MEGLRLRKTATNKIKNITTPTIPSHLNHFGYMKDENNFYILELENNDMSTVLTLIYLTPSLVLVLINPLWGSQDLGWLEEGF